MEDFKLPIEYQSTKIHVPEVIIQDLELLDSPEKSIYDCVFKPYSLLGKEACKKWSKYYTDDISYLKETQVMIKNIIPVSKDYTIFNVLWDKFMSHPDFLFKYQYVEQSQLCWLNKIPTFLLMMSVYSMLSPLLFFVSPIMMLIIPFFLLRANKSPITWEKYSSMLFGLLKTHSLTSLFFNFSTSNTRDKLYSLFTASLFVLQTYGNCISCYQFYKNTYTIHEHVDNKIEHTKTQRLCNLIRCFSFS